MLDIGENKKGQLKTGYSAFEHAEVQYVDVEQN